VHSLEQLAHEGLAIVAPRSLVNPARLVQRGAHAHARVQRRVRVLEDHLHAPAQLAQLASARRADVHALEPDRPAVRLDEPDEAARQRRLAAARSTRDAEDLAARERERHVVDGPVAGERAAQHLEPRPAQAELLDDPLRFQKRPGAHDARSRTGVGARP
jgi:hypothetical protein